MKHLPERYLAIAARHALDMRIRDLHARMLAASDRKASARAAFLEQLYSAYCFADLATEDTCYRRNVARALRRARLLAKLVAFARHMTFVID